MDRALAKLSTHRRLLVIGAHPDDEDTALLTLVSRHLGGEAGYLALSRGDGGQNLIGTELGEGLGLIRTQELVSARRIDGAHQFFTRAFDFGYTRSLEETLERWPREELLEDAARVVWRFRPQVIVAMFSPETGGHGQHRAAGWVAQELFGIDDPATRFPGLIEEHLSPWEPSALYRRAWFDPENASFDVSLGDVDGLSGRSMLQIAMLSRSQHRSQDMGMLQPMGSRRAGLEWVTGGMGEGSEGLFAGVDTRLEAIADLLEEAPSREQIRALLAEVASRAKMARVELSPADLGGAVEGLSSIVEALRSVRSILGGEISLQGARAASELIEEKIAVAEMALLAAAGVGLEAVVDREALAPGTVAELTTQVWNAGRDGIEVSSIAIGHADGWSIERREGEGGALPPSELAEWTFAAAVTASAKPSKPYFLRQPRVGDLYDWSTVEPGLRGRPYQSPELVARFGLRVGGVEVEVEREVVYRTRDQAVGEVRRPVRIVPPVEVSVEPSMLLWVDESEISRSVEVTISSHLEQPVAGSLEAHAPPGWQVVGSAFSIQEAGGRVSMDVEIRAPQQLERGRATVNLVARLSQGETVDVAVPLMEYPHIRPTPLPVAASIEISSFPLQLPDVSPIGYVRGASDRVPEFLRQVGLEVDVLDRQQLLSGDFADYRVIVVGSRAYEADPTMAAANSGLLDFARGGGLLIVQYQQYQFVRGGFAPFPLEIARPHDRITDETTAVRLLQPRHRVFTTPNLLTARDWDGWVQERGLYLAHSWGEPFVPLLAMTDPGMEEQQGGLLVAPLGDGMYVYTGLAFFRQLPAGVAGGYRLLANLLALESVLEESE